MTGSLADDAEKGPIVNHPQLQKRRSIPTREERSFDPGPDRAPSQAAVLKPLENQRLTLNHYETSSHYRLEPEEERWR